MYFFSKSKFVNAWDCIKKAWIGKYHSEEIKITEEERAIMEEGTRVGELARGMFGPFVDVTVKKEDGEHLDLQAMIDRTREEMAKGTEVICEASFSYNGLYCAVDLLRRDGDCWVIYEVKSSTDLKKENKLERYTMDISYQRYVLEHCGIRLAGTYLVHVDNSYVLGNNGVDLSAYFKKLDLTEVTAEKQKEVEALLDRTKAVLDDPNEPDMAQYACGSCNKCDAKEYCMRNLPHPNVFDVYGMRIKKKLEYFRRGYISFSDLELFGALDTDMQQRQVDYALRDKGTYVDKPAIQAFLSQLSYPLYFLDFETMGPAIPIYPGTKPYASIPFQYSLHYIEQEGGDLKHREFLAESGPDPRRAVAESICRDIPDNVCVTAYHKSVEQNILMKLAAEFPDLQEYLEAIAGNIVDMEEPFSKGMYYKREIGNTFSIKSVLSAIYPELDYHKLEGTQNGLQAKDIFPKIRDMSPEEREKTRKGLLEYCERDTLAMVKVWEELNRVVSDH